MFRPLRCFVFLLFSVLAMPMAVLASVDGSALKTPCLIQNAKGNWTIDRDQTCIMYAEAYWRDKIYSAIQTAQAFRKSYQPTCELMKKEYAKLDKSHLASEKRWELRFKHRHELLTTYQADAKNWRDSYLKLQQMKTPPKHWTDSGVFWFSVGVLSAVAVTAVVAGIVIALKEQPVSTKSSGLLVPYAKHRQTLSRTPMIRVMHEFVHGYKINRPVGQKVTIGAWE